MKIPVKLTLSTNLKHYGVTNGTIHNIELEEYVKAVTASEIGNSHIEACKAQAIAARTFAQRRVRNRGFVHDTVIDQAFIITRNNKQEYPNAIQAAEETSGKILTYKGTILLDCPYGAGNGGRTKAYKNYPYLIEQDDPWDKAETAIMLSKNQKVRRGNGYGMSQYGARYAANNGVGNEKILGFYYPTADITTIENYAVDTPTEEVNALPLSTKEQAIKEWALSQVGYGYVWGATGQILTRSVLEQLIARHGTNVKMPTAEKWIGKKVFDCASLVAEASRQILNLKMVSGASSQWKGNYWESKGTIDTQPKDRVVFLYRTSPNANPMQHTGIYLGNGEVVDARGTNSGVMKSKLEKYAWTHWAIPKGLGSITEPKPEQEKEVNNVSIGTATVMNGRLALRSAPSKDGRLIMYIPDKTTVPVLERANNEWFKVEHMGYTGYSMASFMNFTPAVTTGKYVVKITCENKAEADMLVRLLKGAVIE